MAPAAVAAGAFSPIRIICIRALWGRRSMSDFVEVFIERGDLAHLALLLWAVSASGLAWFALRELAAASRRFDDFVCELARFNERCENERLGLRRRSSKRRSPGCPGPLCGPPAS
jgi:hypothetical protein